MFGGALDDFITDFPVQAEGIDEVAEAPAVLLADGKSLVGNSSWGPVGIYGCKGSFDCGFASLRDANSSLRMTGLR
jgi:hypothetical protein